MLASLKRKLASWCLGHLYALPDQKATLELRLDARKRVKAVLIGGREVGKTELPDLKLWAQELRKHPLNVRLMRHFANEAAINIGTKATTLDDLLANRMVLWALDQQRQFIDLLADMPLGDGDGKVLE